MRFGVLTRRWPPSCLALQKTHSQSVVPITLPATRVSRKHKNWASDRSHRAANGPRREREERKAWERKRRVVVMQKFDIDDS
jgi:hypothetical protein